ncbi:MAG: hypothetical protein H7239_01180 [Flavobacterium sp.]|nr:hypothetical protein [Flavobacterium sp.]
MKQSIAICFLLISSLFSYGQEVNVPENSGDNFSLEGALAILKKSNSVEEFETLLNKEDNNVNNLDLNNDGDIDYISVNDIQEGETHVLVLSTFLSETEKQDIATIGIEKTGPETVTLQIEGNTDLYPANTIAEPFDTIETSKGGKSGPNLPQINVNNIIVNVWFWPSIRFIYGPRYVAFRSPYRWATYPIWWKPWHPFRRSIFYSRCAPNSVFYRRTPARTVIVAHNIYSTRRNRSTLVIRNRRGGTTIVRTNKIRPNNAIRSGNSIRVNTGVRGGRRRR